MLILRGLPFQNWKGNKEFCPKVSANYGVVEAVVKI